MTLAPDLSAAEPQHVDDSCCVCGALGGYGLGPPAVSVLRWYCRDHRPREWDQIGRGVP